MLFALLVPLFFLANRALCNPPAKPFVPKLKLPLRPVEDVQYEQVPADRFPRFGPRLTDSSSGSQRTNSMTDSQHTELMTGSQYTKSKSGSHDASSMGSALTMLKPKSTGSRQPQKSIFGGSATQKPAPPQPYKPTWQLRSHDSDSIIEGSEAQWSGTAQHDSEVGARSHVGRDWIEPFERHGAHGRRRDSVRQFVLDAHTEPPPQHGRSVPNDFGPEPDAMHQQPLAVEDWLRRAPSKFSGAQKSGSTAASSDTSRSSGVYRMREKENEEMRARLREVAAQERIKRFMDSVANVHPRCYAPFDPEVYSSRHSSERCDSPKLRIIKQAAHETAEKERVKALERAAQQQREQAAAEKVKAQDKAIERGAQNTHYLRVRSEWLQRLMKKLASEAWRLRMSNLGSWSKTRRLRSAWRNIRWEYLAAREDFENMDRIALRTQHALEDHPKGRRKGEADSTLKTLIAARLEMRGWLSDARRTFGDIYIEQKYIDLVKGRLAFLP